MQSRINYSQSWEDPAVLREALRIGSADTVLSITSGGDNTLALLLDGPKRIVSIDLNASETALLKLKIAALRELPYDELVAFLGYGRASSRQRFEYAERLSSSELDARLAPGVGKGVVHSGKFERFLLLFSSCVLPLIHSQRDVRAFCESPSLGAQRDYFTVRWDTRRWRLAFGIMAGKTVLRAFARQRGMFRYARAKSVAATYRARFEKHLMTVPIRDNHFMRYLLLGKECETVPDCFQPRAATEIRASLDRVEPITADIVEHLRSVAPQSYSRYNLSDVFEALPEDVRAELWREIARTASNGARVAFWENLVQVEVPVGLSSRILEDRELGAALRAKDRAPFYGAFRIFTIRT